MSLTLGEVFDIIRKCEPKEFAVECLATGLNRSTEEIQDFLRIPVGTFYKDGLDFNQPIPDSYFQANRTMRFREVLHRVEDDLIQRATTNGCPEKMTYPEWIKVIKTLVGEWE